MANADLSVDFQDKLQLNPKQLPAWWEVRLHCCRFFTRRLLFDQILKVSFLCEKLKRAQIVDDKRNDIQTLWQSLI